MTTSTIQELEQRLQAGDLAAATECGVRLLNGEWGRPYQQRGADLIAGAADAGHGEAVALLAMMTGAGVFRRQSWPQALDFLQLSAELGWKQAQAQVALLAADRDLAQRSTLPGAGTAMWKALRDTVDINAWTTAPPKQSISDSPKIRRIEQFVPAGVCSWMIMRGRGKLRRAQVYGAKGEASFDPGRTNSETDFSIVEADLVLLLLRARIASATGLPTPVMELTKVLHYAPGQQFAPHYDFIDPEVEGYADEIAVRGQRIATFLVYLNEEYEGGETGFPTLGLRHRGKRGDALLFANVDALGRPDTRTLHAGLPPTKGEKWLLSQWLRDRSPADC